MILVIKGKAEYLIRDGRVRNGDWHIIYHQEERKFMSAGDRVWHDYDYLMEDIDCGSMKPHLILEAAQEFLDKKYSEDE